MSRSIRGWVKGERAGEWQRVCVCIFLFGGETDDLNESSLTALIHSQTEEDHRDGTEALGERQSQYKCAHVHAHLHLHYALQGATLIFKTWAISGYGERFPLPPCSRSYYTYTQTHTSHMNHYRSALTPSRFQVAIAMGARAPLSSYWIALKALTSENKHKSAILSR